MLIHHNLLNKFKDEITSITNLAATAALTTVDNKIPNVNDLVQKADYNEDIKDIKDKYFTRPDCNKFTNNILDAKIATKKLMNQV